MIASQRRESERRSARIGAARAAASRATESLLQQQSLHARVRAEEVMDDEAVRPLTSPTLCSRSGSKSRRQLATKVKTPAASWVLGCAPQLAPVALEGATAGAGDASGSDDAPSDQQERAQVTAYLRRVDFYAAVAETEARAADAASVRRRTPAAAPETNAVTAVHMTVRVPPHLSAGMSMVVLSPDGRRFKVRIPEGFTGGSELRVTMNSRRKPGT